MFSPRVSPRSPRSGRGNSSQFLPVLPPDQSLNHLPPEILKHVLEFLPADQLVRSGRVCTLWLELSRQSSIWRYIFRREYHDWYDSSIAASLKLFEHEGEDNGEARGADWKQIFWKTSEVHNNWLAGKFATKTFTTILRTVRSVEVAGNLLGNTSGAQLFLWDLSTSSAVGVVRPPNTNEIRSFRFLDQFRVVCTGGPGPFLHDVSRVAHFFSECVFSFSKFSRF